MSFTGNEVHDISLQEASDLTANYRISNPGAVLGFYYSKLAISNILAQTDCVGIRIYYAEDDLGSPKMVISGVLSNEDDIDTGLLAEFGTPCPPNKGKNDPLNS